MRENCNECKYYKRSFDGHCNADFCCGNEQSDNYCVPVEGNDTCDNWKEND